LEGRNFDQERRESISVDQLLLKTMAELGATAAIMRQRVVDNAFHLQLHSPAYELTALQRETPWIIGGARDTDSLVGYHVRGRFCVASEAASRVGA
jgi:hypothetical protein